MRVRTFVVPFAKIVPDDAHELEFGPDDHVVIRPFFGLSKTEIDAWNARMNAVDDASTADPIKAPEMAHQLVLDMLNAAIIEWRLDGPNGPIPMPTTPEALDALPGTIAGSLFRFLSTYRGEATANPTTRG